MQVDDLRRNSRLASLLSEVCDFDVNVEGEEPYFRLSGVPFELIAKDGSGNQFAVLSDPEGSILYVCHEGQAGVIAASLQEALQLFLAAPYWRDLLKFSGGGEAEIMRHAAHFLDRDATEDGLDAGVAELEVMLGMRRLTDPVGVLHGRVTESSVVITSDESDAEPFESLFNTFVPADNPFWSGAAN